MCKFKPKKVHSTGSTSSIIVITSSIIVITTEKSMNILMEEILFRDLTGSAELRLLLGSWPYDLTLLSKCFF